MRFAIARRLLAATACLVLTGGTQADTDSDCATPRLIVLKRTSLTPVTLDSSACRITAGSWVDSYTGQWLDRPRDVVLDRVIHARWARRHGGEQWSRQRLRAFLNDPLNLLVTSDTSARARRGADPAHYLPDANTCSYARRWRAVLERYALQAESSVREALASACEGR